MIGGPTPWVAPHLDLDTKGSLTRSSKTHGEGGQSPCQCRDKEKGE